MPVIIRRRGVLAAVLFASLAADCFAQTYKINFIVDGTTPIPGGTGTFSPYGDVFTSTDGRYVSFYNLDPPSVYTYDTKTKQFARIADTTVAVPGGTGNFTGFFYNFNDPNQPAVANGMVVFWGNAASGGGIYSEPASGGPIKLIVNTSTSSPGGGVFNNFRRISTDGSKVVFTAETTKTVGTYTYNLDGTVATIVGDGNVVVSSGNLEIGYDLWYYPTISNGEVAVLADEGASDPSRVLNAIFTAPYTGVIGDPYPYNLGRRPTETVSTTNLPGNTNTNFHTRFDAFALSNATLGILADDSFGSYEGVFSAPAAIGQVNAPLTTLADTVDNPTLEFDTSLGIANDNGTIAFAVRDMANSLAVAIYSYLKGTGLTKVAEIGMPVANTPGTPVAALYAGLGLNSAANGAIAFASSQGQIYLATLNSTAITSVGTAFGGSAIAQNTWVQINGNNLVPATTPAAGVTWSSAPSFASGQMPTNLNGVSVTVNGKPAFVYFYCSAATSSVCTSDQINILTPLDNTIGPVQVVVTNGTTASPAFTATLQAISPTFLLFSANGYIVATHANGSLLGPTSLYPGASTPAQAGETVVIYTIGFGLPTTAIVNGSASQNGSLPGSVTCKIGNSTASLPFVGLISPGLYQLNVTVPLGTPSGDNPITCSYNGSTTPQGLLSVQ